MIRFHYENAINTQFLVLNKANIKRYLKRLIHTYDRKVGDINYIFCNDAYLLDINQRFIKHDFYTDIITFDNSRAPSVIDADIFISITRVMDNARTLKVPAHEEVLRVMTHGILHILGYGDTTAEEIKAMRDAENECIQSMAPFEISKLFEIK